MDKQVIKAIIGEKQQEIKEVKLLQRGEIFDSQSRYVLTGIRRAGKSYTLYQDMLNKMSSGMAKVEDLLYINF